MTFGVELQMKIDPPGEARIKRIIGKLRRALMVEGKIHKKMLQKVTKTWKGTKPRFRIVTELTQDRLAIITFPTGSEMAVNKFLWLDQGTSIRWAVMSRDWSSKTQIRVLGSRAGRGNVVIAGKKAMQARNIQPRPGIEPRLWTEEVRKRRAKPFARKMQKELDLAVEEFWDE